MAMDEGIKSRASSLLTQLDCLPPHKLAPSARSRLSKLLRSEIRFLHGLSDHTASALNSTNLGYLEAVLQVVRHPCVDAVSAVLQTYTVSSSLNKAAKANKDHEKLAEVHVDIVCTFQAKPVWIIVSDRNPKYSYWSDECSFVKGWQSRVQLLVNVAQSFSVLQPAAVFFCFARGVLSSLVTGFEAEVGASRIELFGENEVIRSNAIETLGTEFGEMSFETDDEDWVCIQVSRKQVDLDVPSQDLKHRVTSTTADVTCKDWVTFQVDINASLDGFEVLDCRGPGLKKIHKQAPSENLLPHRVMGTVFKSNGQENLDAVTSCQLQHVGKLDPSHDGFHYVFGDCNGSFLSFLSTLWPRESLLGKIENSVSTSNLVNLDTTALIALVSEVSNGAASMLVDMCNKDLVSKFGNTAQFMKDQAEEELKSPLLEEIANLLAHRRPFISESVCREFKSLVSLCGGFEEKTRAEELLNFLPVVPDTPSARVMNLCETGKIKEKNKVVFGTGDCWQAPTLTANLSFVRAVRQTGMALSVLEHKPRALVGEKCR